jgi:uncharacterized protein YndB with AHSA1/START domain
MRRTDTGSRFIKAPAGKIYAAHLDPRAVAAWRPPPGMRAEIYDFDAREGGGYRMALIYRDAEHQVAGKTTAHADVVEGRFVELIPGQRIVEAITFESGDPAFAGTMTITTSLRETTGGTEVGVVCTDVPTGIRQEDHLQGIALTLESLARYVE